MCDVLCMCVLCVFCVVCVVCCMCGVLYIWYVCCVCVVGGCVLWCVCVVYLCDVVCACMCGVCGMVCVMCGVCVCSWAHLMLAATLGGGTMLLPFHTRRRPRPRTLSNVPNSQSW